MTSTKTRLASNLAWGAPFPIWYSFCPLRVHPKNLEKHANLTGVSSNWNEVWVGYDRRDTLIISAHWKHANEPADSRRGEGRCQWHEMHRFSFHGFPWLFSSVFLGMWEIDVEAHHAAVHFGMAKCITNMKHRRRGDTSTAAILERITHRRVHLFQKMEEKNTSAIIWDRPKRNLIKTQYIVGSRANEMYEKAQTTKVALCWAIGNRPIFC